MESSDLAARLAEAKATARDQLSAAWQLQMEMLEAHLSTLLSTGWRERIERIFEERFTELTSQVEQHVRRDGDERAAAARRVESEELNRHARRIRQAADHSEWIDAVLDAASRYGERVALFGVFGGVAKLEAQRGFSGHQAEVPLDSAPAFRAAIESLEPVVAMRIPSEVSETVIHLASGGGSRMSHLVPLVSHRRAVALLYVEADEAAEMAGLELLAAVASAALETRAPKPLALVAVASANAGGGSGSAPSRDWASLTRTEQQAHLKAQRFARVQVAAMRLYKSAEVRRGRKNADLYQTLRVEIDSGRDEFRSQFSQSTPPIPDYFHLELVHTLANDDPALLGPEYPGPIA